MSDDVWHVGDSPKAKATPEEKAAAVAKFQQWADDDSHAKREVEKIFNDRRPNG